MSLKIWITLFLGGIVAGCCCCHKQKEKDHQQKIQNQTQEVQDQPQQQPHSQAQQIENKLDGNHDLSFSQSQEGSDVNISVPNPPTHFQKVEISVQAKGLEAHVVDHHVTADEILVVDDDGNVLSGSRVLPQIVETDPDTDLVTDKDYTNIDIDDGDKGFAKLAQMIAQQHVYLKLKLNNTHGSVPRVNTVRMRVD